MARQKSKASYRRGLIDNAINNAQARIEQERKAAQEAAKTQIPDYAKGMSLDDVNRIIDSYNSQNTIPKLEQNTTPNTPSISDELERMKKAKADTTTPRTEGEQKAIDTYYDSLVKASGQKPNTSAPKVDYRAEIDRMNALKADTSAPRTEGENQAIDTYLNSLTDAQRYLDSQKSVSTTTKSGTKVKKQPIGTVEIKADGTKKFTKAMSAEEKKNFENQIRRQNQLEQAKVVGKQAKENAQPKERALSANEQRDLERALTAATQAQAKEREQNSLPNKLKAMAEPFTKLPKKDKPQYDRAGFEINPSITENQSTVDEYLDPNKKLSQADEKKAKQLIREYEESDLGQKNENATTLVFDNEHPDGMAVPSYAVDENGVYHPYLELTPEERQYQQSIGDLKTKVKDSESFLLGAMNTIPAASAFAAAGRKRDEDFANMFANAQKQNPLSYVGGALTGGLMANTAGQFALKGTQYGDWLAKTLGADKSLARQIATDALMDAPVDVATDIIPTLAADIASGQSAGQVAKNTLGNIGINAAFNLGGSLIGNAGDIIGSLRKAPNVDIPVVENPVPIATTKNTVNEVADSAVKNLNNEIPIVENPIKNVVPEVRKLPETIEDIPKDVNDYVATRDILIRQANDAVKTQNASEVARLEQAVDNMDNYMKQNYPEWFKGKNFKRDEYNKLNPKVVETESNIKPITNAKDTKKEIGELIKDPDFQPITFVSNDTEYILHKSTRDGEKWQLSILSDTGEFLGHGAYKTDEQLLSEINRLKDISYLNTSGHLLNSNSVTFADMISNPDAFTREDFERAFLTWDHNASPQEAELEELITGLKQIVEDDPELADMSVELPYWRETFRNEYLNANPLAREYNTTLKKIYPQQSEEIDSLLSQINKDIEEGKDLTRYINKLNSALDDVPSFEIEDRVQNLINELSNIEKNRTNTMLSENAIEQTAKNIQPEINASVPPVNDLPEGTGELVERGASRHIRSVNDVTEYTPMKYDVPDEVSNEFIDNPDMYRQLKNVDTQARADAIYERGGDVETTFRTMLDKKDPASLPLGHRLAKDYSAAGEYEKAAQIYRDMGEKLTEAGQFSQASVLAMMKNDPLTALYYAQKEIDALNASGAKRFGKKWKNFELTPEEVKAFGKIEPGNEKAIADLYDQVGARLGKEYPTTVMDKLLEARRVSMLFNLRTNFRNFGANIPTLAMRWVSDRVDSLGQHFVHLLNPDFEVTNSIKGAGFRGRKLANEVYNSDAVQAMLKGTNGKYSPDISSSLMQNKQVFKGTPVSRWINRVTNGGIEKVNKKLFGKEGVESGLETVRNATYKALELGDTPFVRENFVERLGSYINARGIKNINDIPDDAIQVAWEEAMKATYKDNSWAVQMLRNIKNGMESIPGVGRPISQAVIPFLQAPGNIAARMVDYSPIKATKGIVDMISGANSGNLNAVRKGIEEFSKGATGTGMIVLGMKLKESGLITGDYSEDKDQRNFEKQHGFKPYALHIGDKYFTYDWAQPFAEPMIIGTLLQEAIDNSDQYDSEILKYFGHEGTTAGKIIGGLKEGASASVNSWFNASPLQGLADLMKSDYSGDSSIAENIYDKTVVDFASSFIPSLVNSAAKTADPIMRNTYDPSNAFGTFLNEQAAKLPGASDNLPAKFDTWGNEMKYADSKGESFARKFVIPGDYGKDNDDPIDNEINRLFEETSDNRVFPLTAPTSVDGVKLNNREVSEYQEDMGQRSREIVEALMDSDYYDGLKESNKAETLNTVYAVSKAITERDLFDKEISDNSEYKKAITAYDEGGAEGLLNYLEGKAITNSAGVSTTSKAGQIIQDRFNTGDKEGAQALANDITTLEGYGIPTKGQGVYADRGSYNYDAETYSRFYNQIDVGENGEPGNGSVSQDEMIKFFEKNHITDPVKMQKMWESFLTTYTPGETKVPYYDKESKTVKTKKPDDSFKSTIPGLEETPETKIATPEQDWDSATLSDDPYAAIAQTNIAHGNQYINQAWDKAYEAVPSLTPQQFIKEWSAIDSSKDGVHSQDEIINHMNSAKMSKKEGEELAAKYWHSNWKKKPKLNNEGVWYYS